MIRGGAGDRRRGGPASLRIALVLLTCGLVTACASSDGPDPSMDDPRGDRRATVTTEGRGDAPTGTVAELQDEADDHFTAGERAYRAGHYEVARSHFDRALDVFLQADVEPDEEAALREAFNEMVTRIHSVELDELVVPLEVQTSPLVEEDIPPLTLAETELLRSRLVERRAREEARPSFTIPMPDPLDNPKVLAAVEYLSTDRKEVVEEGLSRAGRYLPMIRRIFEEEGAPRELAWVPLIESLFKPHVRSHAAAVGMWQFMAGTARLFGLQIDWYVDERRDPVKATRTAAKYLKELYQEFGDWHLALAAYNGGKGRVARAMRRTGIDDFWGLAETRYLPRETRDFVPKILAAILLGTDPEQYGLDPNPAEPWAYDEVTIDSMTDLRVIADCAGTSLDVIRELNPQLLKATTPNRDSYTLRIPKGTEGRFRQAFAAIPPDERVFFVRHRVRRGETLSEIAGSYKTSVRAIQDLNNLRSAHWIRQGQDLIVPVGQPGRPYRGRPAPAGDGYRSGERIEYRVQRGDSLALIASTFRTTAPDLMRWNDLDSDLIFPGDRLTVYYDTRGEAPEERVTSPTPSESDEARTLYTVRRGDSLYTIARRYSVGIDDLQRWNELGRRTIIYPGDKLVLHVDRRLADGAPGRRYTVRPGDTLSEIAERFDTSLRELLVTNGLSSRSTIHPGDEIRVPGASSAVIEDLGDAPEREITYTVRRGDTLSEIAARYRVSVSDLCSWNGIGPGTTLHPGDRLTIRTSS